jgi:oligopeptide transport system permease protein
MTKYIIVRTIWVFVVLLTILTLNFTLLKLAPEYPPTEEKQQQLYYSRQVFDGYMEKDRINQTDPISELFVREVYQQTKGGVASECFEGGSWYCPLSNDNSYVSLHTPVPISVQYFNWIYNIVTDWNWGYTTRVQVNNPVFDVLKDRIPVTLRLNLVALFFYIPIGFGLGIVAALKKNSVADNLISLGVMIFISVPSFVTMTLLLWVFGYQLEWLPSQFPGADIEDLAVQIKGMILPVLGLSFGAIAGLTRLTRAELTEVLTSEFLLLARTKGLTRQQAVIRHAMRNSMVPLVPSIIGSFVGLLSGSVVIEIIYTIPGTGRLFIRAMTRGAYDYNLILGTTAFYTIISLFAVLLVDLSYGLVDPRIRMGARK